MYGSTVQRCKFKSQNKIYMRKKKLQFNKKKMADTKIYSKGEKVIITFLFIFAITALVLSAISIHKSRNTTVNDSSTTNNSNGGSDGPGTSSADNNWTTDIAWAAIFKNQLIACPMWNNAQGDSFKYPFPVLKGGSLECILPTSINSDKGLGDQPFVVETGTNDILDTKYNNLLMFTPKRTGCYKFTVNLKFDLAYSNSTQPVGGISYTEYTKKQLVYLHLQPVENPTAETSFPISSCYPTLDSYGNGPYSFATVGGTGLIASLNSNERYFNSTRIFLANTGQFLVGTKYCFSIHFQDLPPGTAGRAFGFLNLVDCNIKIEFWDVASS